MIKDFAVGKWLAWLSRVLGVVSHHYQMLISHLPLKCQTASLPLTSLSLIFKNVCFTLRMVWGILWEGGRSSFAVRRYCLNVQKVFDYSQWSWPRGTQLWNATSPPALKTGVGRREARTHLSRSFFHDFLSLSISLFPLFKQKIGLRKNKYEWKKW